MISSSKLKKGKFLKLEKGREITVQIIPPKDLFFFPIIKTKQKPVFYPETDCPICNILRKNGFKV